jgi:hypothetical protein
MLRILDSLEDCTQSWITPAVKKRENLDQADRRDHAQSPFMMGPFGTHQANGVILRALYQPPAANATANAIAAAAAALLVQQTNAIEAPIADANSPVVEANRLALTSYCALTAGELGIFQEFVRVYEEALCHFLFKLCTEKCVPFPKRGTHQGIGPTTTKNVDVGQLRCHTTRPCVGRFESK